MQDISIIEESERKLLRRLAENDRLFLRRFYSLLEGIFRSLRALPSTQRQAVLERAAEKKLVKFLRQEVLDVFALGEAHAALLCREKIKRFERRKLASFIPWFCGWRLAKVMDVDPKDLWSLSSEAIEAFKLRENMLAKDVGDALWKDVRRIMDAHLKGTPRKETLAKLTELQHVTERRAALIVTTESTYAYNRGRLAGYKKAGVDYVRFSAVVDLRTSAQCRSRHGKVMRLDSAELAGNTPPLHGRCRSVLSPIYSRYEPEAITPETTDWSKTAPLPKGWRMGGVTNVEKRAYLKMEDAAAHKAAVEIVRADMALMPKKHLDLLEKSNVRVTFGHEYSHFNRHTGELAITKTAEPGEFLHEAAHAIETYLRLHENPAFMQVLKKGIPMDKITREHFAIDVIQGRQLLYLVHPDIKKFVTEYQTRSYENGILGGERFFEENGKEIFNLLTLGEYFSEGYRFFFQHPELLREKDWALYRFIEEMTR